MKQMVVPTVLSIVCITDWSRLPLAIPPKPAKSFNRTIPWGLANRQQESNGSSKDGFCCRDQRRRDTSREMKPVATARRCTDRNPRLASRRAGLGQLSLVEHALCPLDARTSLRPGLRHETTFHFSDARRRRRTARVEVSCPHGLSAHDEFYLWGLLALTLSQPNPETEFHATPHYCLRQWGLVDSNVRRGGRQYQQFAAAIERLSWVKYGCDAFYDPIRAEHCQVRFGLFSYRLPLDPQSSRAWRFHWDGQFFEFVKAAGGSLRFDLELYRRLSPGARRLFLFASKVFARSPQLPRMDLRHLAVDVLGLSASMAAKHLLAKSRRICAELAAEGVILELQRGTIQKRGKGQYDIILHRGQGFGRQHGTAPSLIASPLAEPLRSIGLDEVGIGRVLRQFPPSKVREWADITLAAKEKFGLQFFKRSPVAYFLDNLKKSIADGRTAPDWWHDIRKAEELEQAHHDRDRAGRNRQEKSLEDASRTAFEKLRRDLFQQLRSAGLDDCTALREAGRRAQRHVARNPRHERPTLAGDILATLPVKLPK